jgi:flagellar hook-length control protein FliK
MNVTSMPTLPATPPPATAPADCAASAGPAATGFAALLAALATTEGATGGPKTTAPTPAVPAEPEPTEPEPTGDDSTGSEGTAGERAPVIGTPTGVPVPVVPAPGAGAPTEAPGNAQQPVGEPASATPTGEVSEGGVRGLASSASTGTDGVPLRAADAGAASPTEATSRPLSAAATSSASSAPPATVPDGSLAAAAPPTPAAATSAATAPEPAPAPHAVTRQVFPEVARLVSRGDGSHRLTMTLQPEALGEVRVTLTVRQGEVHVRLAAGEEARAALLEGSAELRRVLELSGATDTRVVVRDLNGTGTTGQQSTAPGDTGRGDPGATGHRDRDTDDHDAGTRRGSTARDGTTDGAFATRPEPVVAARSAGVDLTM